MDAEQDKVKEPSSLTSTSSHEHTFHLDLDGLVTCNVCGCKDDSTLPNIAQVQIYFE